MHDTSVLTASHYGVACSKSKVKKPDNVFVFMVDLGLIQYIVLVVLVVTVII